MLRKLRKRGQSTAEYAILIGLVIAAAVGMQLYVKRGLQARTKGGMEYFFNVTSGNADVNLTAVNYTRQYEPYYQNSAYDVAQTSNQQMKMGKITNVLSNYTTIRALGGYQSQGNMVQE
jgi:uncharacterized protein (UPF0333 family)